MPLQDPDALSVTRHAGLRPTEVIGRGVEGTVVGLAGGRVAKVWRDRPGAEVRRLAAFYAEVAAAGPALATPRIERVLEADGRVVSVEHRLPGRALWVADGASIEIGPRETGALVEALAALAAVAATPGMRTLPVLPGEPPFPGGSVFEHDLADLVVRRAERSRRVLVRHLPDLDDLLAAVTATLRALPPAAPTLVHGDLIPGNVLVDAAHALAVVDFGFLTTTGDPAFDAAVAASCFDMYGPRALRVEAVLDAELRVAFGYDAARLQAYRAAYALATATCFGVDGSDGHFAWCVRMLQRPAVGEAIGLAGQRARPRGPAEP